MTPMPMYCNSCGHKTETAPASAARSLPEVCPSCERPGVWTSQAPGAPTFTVTTSTATSA